MVARDAGAVIASQARQSISSAYAALAVDRPNAIGVTVGLLRYARNDE